MIGYIKIVAKEAAGIKGETSPAAAAKTAGRERIVKRKGQTCSFPEYVL
jgi:hypothetical protein